MSDEEEAPNTSVFPLFSVSSSLPAPPPPLNLPSAPQWLSNSSFTTDISVINNAVASRSAPVDLEEDDEVEEDYEKNPQAKPSPSYELVQSSDSDRESKKKRKKRKRKSRDSKEKAFGDYGSRKSGVRVWDNSDSKPSKDYYFDSRGDRDNLAFGSIYRMDVARYKPYDPAKGSGRFLSAGLHLRNQRGSMLDGDADADALDGKLKSVGRYWSAKYAALERNRNLKRVRILAQENSSVMVPGDFIPFSDVEKSLDVADNSISKTKTSVQESWEDEVLRKTRDFNKLTREYPHNEKVWLDFAEFQDRIASMQPQKGARLQTFEKKISILEKATELNPDNEELLLALMKAYQSRDNIDVLIDRWEKILMQHSGSYKLWREFLYVVQGEFSRFKVSDMRKMYSHAIQALSASCSKQFRLINLKGHPCVDHATVQQELGLVDVFLSLCRFEWQAGYQELATALFQAEIEFSLFCPSLLLNENSKQRLFEHFWSSNGARVGEEGALGWSTWLEKEEENRQRIVKEENEREENEKGGWTGWSEPSSKNQDTSQVPENVADDGEVRTEGLDDSQEDVETEGVEEEEDTETLLKMLGIGDTGVSGEVKDLSTWIKWSEEESSRDCDEWMPLRTKNGQPSDNNGTSDMESDEQLSRVILYEDVSEYLFSLSSEEARLSLLFQFIEFFGGKISQWSSTNCSSWTEKFNSIEDLPDSILDHIRRVAKVLAEIESSSVGLNLESLLGSSNDISRKIEMMKFLQNAALLCLTAFPRNHILEEAALIAEELSVTKMNSLRSSATPCRALAKRLLKSDRQDVLLCGVYARREAVFGNIDHARRVFDMALSSIEGLPPDQKSNALLIYLWYAEAEVANGSESSCRAMHILSCIGSGAVYSPYKNQPSSLQLLRAHQGFKERIKAVRSTWMRGVIDDQSVALVCSAALFEELTTGWEAGTEILDQAFMMVLPERRSQSYQLEFLYNFYVRMLQRHHKQSSLSKVWGSILQGLQVYPSSVELFNTLMETSHLYTTPNKLRWMFDQHCLKNPSVIVWLFALSFELSRGGSQHRIHGLFERALASSTIRNSVVLWRCYIAYELNVLGNPSAARRIFFRAIHACPWSKKLWLDGFVKLNSILSAKELSDLQEVMRDKELNLRTDIYEILLRDEIVS